MSEIRLMDIVKFVPPDIQTGIIKRKNGTEIEFNDISEVIDQLKYDHVGAFDIRKRKSGDRIFIVWLVHN